jgi:hypothetical protein
MGQRVLHLYLGSWNGSWWHLDEEKRRSLMAAAFESIEANGGRVVTGGYCEWSTSEHEHFGVEEYHSIGALRKHLATERAIGLAQHYRAQFFAAVPWESED